MQAHVHRPDIYGIRLCDQHVAGTTPERPVQDGLVPAEAAVRYRSLRMRASGKHSVAKRLQTAFPSLTPPIGGGLGGRDRDRDRDRACPPGALPRD